MTDRESLTPAERELASTLAGLAPSAHRIDRDRLMFDAGRRAASRVRWMWPGVSAALLTALVVSLVRPREPQVVERIVHVTAPRPAVEKKAMPAPVWPDTEAGDPSDLFAYVKLQKDVLAQGVDALPEPRYFTTAHAGTPMSIGDFLGAEPEHRAPRGPFDLLNFLNVGGNS